MAKEDAERLSGLKKRLTKQSVPQRLKPHVKRDFCGTAEAVPLSKTDFSAFS
jgi:hypothetical protein